mmetsp:Transcript_35112/g.79403  ORF Transcript_35112/g.79403 Transcript_35112/m.79403 type:complete len:254 (-) Transcript_35112:635-1396(-)
MRIAAVLCDCQEVEEISACGRNRLDERDRLEIIVNLIYVRIFLILLRMLIPLHSLELVCNRNVIPAIHRERSERLRPKCWQLQEWLEARYVACNIANCLLPAVDADEGSELSMLLTVSDSKVQCGLGRDMIEFTEGSVFRRNVLDRLFEASAHPRDHAGGLGVLNHPKGSENPPKDRDVAIGPSVCESQVVLSVVSSIGGTRASIARHSLPQLKPIVFPNKDANETSLHHAIAHVVTNGNKLFVLYSTIHILV